jgi:MFS family permease
VPISIVGLAAAALASNTDLPTGIVAEPTLVAAALRWLTVLWAVVLLLFGARLDRATITTLLLIVGVGLGWFVAAEHSIALALGCALLVAAVGMAVFLWVPRLAMAVAMAWPFAALYAAQLWFSGSFEFSRGRVLALVVLGLVVGATAPRRSPLLLSAALGTTLLLGAGPLEPSTLRVLALSIGSVIWQIVVLGAWRPIPQPTGIEETQEPATKGREWARSVLWHASVLVAGWVLVAAAAPMYDLDSVGDQSRLTVLARAGELARPGLVLLAPSNLYLSGRPLPVAIVDERVRLSTRLEFAFLGRSLNDAVSGLRPVKGGPGVSEGEIERRIVQSYVEDGATGVAVKSIVGYGANATLPHYDANRAVMTEGLVVIDIGCSVGGYASDMTRTFSVNGEYTTAQKHLIDTVIEAGDAARAQLAPGVSMRRVGAAAREVIEGAGFGPYFTHGIGHHVGLQVHDPRRDPLEPGMVITIEPGVYIPEGADTDPSYWNLGVRVEDTYIVTDSGWEEITDYPKRPYGE